MRTRRSRFARMRGACPPYARKAPVIKTPAFLPANLELGYALKQYLLAPDWFAVYGIICAQPLLLTDRAVELLQSGLLEAEKRGDEQDVIALSSHKAVLDFTRRWGAKALLELVLRADRRW